MEGTDNRLLEGIIREAEANAKKTEDDARLQAKKILDEARLRSTQELETEQKAFQQKLKQIELRLQANMGSVKRKASLRQIDESYLSVMRRIREKMHCKTIEPYLASWIAEAALGLDLKEAKVSSSNQCPVTEKHLKEAIQLVKKHTGSEVTLSLDPRPIRSLGVVLSSLDDKVSFNNQVEIRLRRFDRVIRTMIQEHT
ncbi:MAG TPA: V-type ATP synthase subunit E family protein [Sphaerochaeta sp.]|nr:V-type ATP synthase subunit E family protein [Sphaerochaeta sp.]